MQTPKKTPPVNFPEPSLQAILEDIPSHRLGEVAATFERWASQCRAQHAALYGPAPAAGPDPLDPKLRIAIRGLSVEALRAMRRAFARYVRQLKAELARLESLEPSAGAPPVILAPRWNPLESSIVETKRSPWSVN